MKGDFTRFTHAPHKHYSRVLKQQGRVDLDADWNEAVELFTRRDRIEATDVIGRCGVPEGSNGFKVEVQPDGSDLTLSPGRLYVNGILCEREAAGPLTDQRDLPDYPLPTEDGVYLAYADVWERHITYLEDPAIREVALGGPDTTTRTQTLCQVKLLRIADDGPLTAHDCQPVPADPSTGRLAAGVVSGGAPTDPCVVPEGAGYTGLENRLYRVEIHDDGRDADGNVVRTPTFKWSRDNGAVVLPLAETNGIDGDTLTLKRLGFDDVLTLQVGDWVEVLGDETVLYGRPGTLAQIVPDGIDAADLEVELDRDVSTHAGEGHLKVRRWDHQPTDDLALVDGALPIPSGTFELEDGVVVEFEAGGTYHIGDYWLIPARTRTGTVEWPHTGTPPAAVPLPPRGIEHHYCTLALVRRSGGSWVGVRDCRPLFPPLTEIGTGGCCVRVEPGDDIQQALDTVIAAGGGCVSLCAGVHRVQGPLWIREATDVTLKGEGSATVVRCNGTDATGHGGIVIESGQRITLTDVFLASDNVPGLITVRHDEVATLNRSIALRRLCVLNLATSDPETNAAAALRLGHADDVTIDACHLAAETAILSLWGNALPDLDAAQDDGDSEDENETEHEAPPVITLDFEDLTLGATFQVGDTITTSGMTATVAPFERQHGDSDETGFVRVEDGGEAGGAGHEMALSNANLVFSLPASYTAVRIAFGDLGGRVNLRINGELQKPQNLADLDGIVVGGVRITVVFNPNNAEVGRLQLDAEARSIETLSIGGQELWLDDVTFRGPVDRPAPHRPAYGDGVIRLHMRGTTVRFSEWGILAARAERWQIDRSDLRPFAEAPWAQLRRQFAEAESDSVEARSPHRDLLATLDTLFATAGPPQGYAIQAFQWRDCAVHCSRLAGRHGLHAWWWLGGTASENEVTGQESGMHAFWLHHADWTANAVTTAEGMSLSVVGAHRIRCSQNRLRGPVGVANVSFGAGIDALDRLAGALLRGYSTDAPGDRDVLYGVLVDESLHIMRFGPLLNALQPIADEASPSPGVPVAYYFADGLLSSLRSQTQNDVLRALPLIDIDVNRNDIACTQQGLGLDGFMPLGRLHVADNRIHTTSGQALRMDTNPFVANAHLWVFILRGLLRLLAEQTAAQRDIADGPMAPVMDALAALVARWKDGAEQLFNLDFRIEGNTIRSQQTAIESNLYELAVRANHITMQERPVAQAPAENTGRIFGQVTTPNGEAVAQAQVRVVGTERVTLTDEKGAYNLPGLPPGAYELRASQTGFSTATQTLTLEGGEEVQVQFTISPLLSAARAHGGVGFSDAVIAARTTAASATNTEIAGVIDALERSVALEPLAIALRDGAHTPPDAYAVYLAGANGPLVTSAARTEAAEAVTLIRGQATDPDIQQVTDQLNTALRANDQTQFEPLFARFIRVLQGYIDTQGILIKGVGGRIVENHVIVPADADPDTEALGGIQVSVNLTHLTVLALLGSFLMKYLGDENDQSTLTDPLLGITDTLIDNNEIVGGVGHGLSVQGVAGQPEFVQDLRVRGNQMRGMAGAGLFVNEHALAVGLDVAGNHISACGRPAGCTAHKGGIVINTAAVCRFDGNHVLRCGAELLDHHAYGVDLDALYGLHCTNNSIRANGAEEGTADDGGMRLIEVYGAALVHDNVVAFNRGLGLSWANSARADEKALLPAFLLNAVNTYLRMNRTVEDLVEEEQASLQGNAFKSVAAADFPVFQLLNLQEVLFSGNTCHAETTSAPLGEIQETGRGVVTNNQTQTNAEVAIAIKKMDDGVVLGNVGNRPIQLRASAGVEHAYNVPPAI